MPEPSDLLSRLYASASLYVERVGQHSEGPALDGLMQVLREVEDHIRPRSTDAPGFDRSIFAQFIHFQQQRDLALRSMRGSQGRAAILDRIDIQRSEHDYVAAASYGATDEEAIVDLARQISGRMLVRDAFSPDREIMRAPVFTPLAALPPKDDALLVPEDEEI